MKINHIIISLLLLISLTTKGQSQNPWANPALLDSLLTQLNIHVKDDQKKVELLNEYARECFINYKIREGFMATREGRLLSEKLNYEKGKMMYYLTLAVYLDYLNNSMSTYYQKKAQWVAKSLGDFIYTDNIDFNHNASEWGIDFKSEVKNFTAILDEFEQLNDKEIQACLQSGISTFYSNLDDLEQLQVSLDKTIQLYADLGDSYPIFLYSRFKMSILNYQDKKDEAKQLEHELVKLFTKSNDDNSIGLITLSMAFVYFENGRFILSIEYFLKSIELFKSTQDWQLLSNAYYNLAVAYEELEMNSKAFDNYSNCITTLNQFEDSTNLRQTFSAIVFPAIAIEKYDTARYYMSKALRDTIYRDYHFTWGRYYDASGQIFKKQGKYDEAIPYFEKALTSFSKASGYQWTAPFMPLYLTECYFSLGNYRLALEHGLQCFDILEKENSNNIKTKKKISLLLSETYEKLGNEPKAFHFLKIHQEIIEQSQKLDEINRLADAEIQSILEKSQKEINELEQQGIRNHQKNRIQRLWIFSITGALLSAILLSLILFRNNKNKQRANAILQKQKEEIQQTLKKLKSTQTQLIQSEKMASLGELTAGIAHEIQNPLNFVNNFSELNAELINEAKEEIDKGNHSEVKVILNDIKENEEKINHHGKRAESIVKGMLQHSRSSSGQKESTDLNALCDEYLRLSYHGLRAKDKSFNADFKLEANENLPKVNVVPQDIGRVLLNLINNAFYAVSEKAKKDPPQAPKGGATESQFDYKPIVKVTTKVSPSVDGGLRGVSITVEDNGNGIPDSVKEKIFQPFFTTKPAGSGTGLGLSLSYDIVKAHGGELKVETKEGEGSEFIIQLPTT